MGARATGGHAAATAAGEVAPPGVPRPGYYWTVPAGASSPCMAMQWWVASPGSPFRKSLPEGNLENVVKCSPNGAAVGARQALREQWQLIDSASCLLGD